MEDYLNLLYKKIDQGYIMARFMKGVDRESDDIHMYIDLKSLSDMKE